MAWTRHRRLLTRASPLAASLALACPEAPPDAVVLPVELDGACPLNERVGLFSVAHEPDYSAIDGEIFEAVIPATIQEPTLTEAGCRLLTRENPFCDPPCTSGETCSQAGSCVPYPERLETGTVTIAGLEVSVAMEPRADKRYFETALPQPVFEAGAPISLTSEGGEVEALALSGRGLEPLELTPGPWILAAGEPAVITWVVDTNIDNVDSTINISINIDQHGASPVVLDCEAPDSGSFEIPATVVDALLAAGVSGFPTGHAYRRTVDSTSTSAGCVEFQVRSHRRAELQVVGHTPCTDDSDCPAELGCDLQTQTCI